MFARVRPRSPAFARVCRRWIARQGWRARLEAGPPSCPTCSALLIFFGLSGCFRDKAAEEALEKLAWRADGPKEEPVPAAAGSGPLPLLLLGCSRVFVGRAPEELPTPSMAPESTGAG